MNSFKNAASAVFWVDFTADVRVPLNTEPSFLLSLAFTCASRNRTGLRPRGDRHALVLSGQAALFSGSSKTLAK
ncbi:hypothetical protein GCM10009754_04280 [Amycolatopsis minnesotensis]|uniref:Uncharacterized protein n=1 Tax=Amycolatopsis minnesotensis TaxID=337894 RepID=A0ABN2Q0J3_9PSEU